MKNDRKQKWRPARSRRHLAEALESRCLLSGTPLSIVSGSVMGLASPMLMRVDSSDAPSNVTVDNNGAIWYTHGNAVTRLASDSAAPATFAVPAGADGNPREVVSNIVFTPDNAGWFAVSDGEGNRIERLSANGQIADETPVLDDSIDMLTVSDNTVWFTQGDSTIGHLTNGGEAALINVPAVVGFSGLAAGPDGNVWFAGDAADDGGVVGKVTPDGGVGTVAIDDSLSNVAAGADGNLYVGGTEAIWQVSPAGPVTRIDLPNVMPEELSGAPDGSIWFADASNSAQPISQLHDGVLTQFSTGISEDAVPDSLAVAPDGDIWFTLSGTATGYVARLDAANNFQSHIVVQNAFPVTGVNNWGSVNSTSFNMSTAGISSITSVPFVLVSLNGVVATPDAGSSDSATTSSEIIPTRHTLAGTNVNVSETAPVDSPAASHAELSVHMDRVLIPAVEALAALKSAVGMTPADEAPDSPDAAPQAPDDPGTFQGEFCILVAAAAPQSRKPASPFDQKGPSLSDPDEGESRPQSSPLSSGQRQPLDVLAAAAGSWTPISMMEGDSSNATAPAHSRTIAVAERPLMLAHTGNITKWWKVAACVSAAVSLQLWRHNEKKKDRL